jgi:hypothetical protein
MPRYWWLVALAANAAVTVVVGYAVPVLRLRAEPADPSTG